ncbi:MAG: DUF2017 family protein [Ilumatobacteraceae bacterium]|nr:DUF2017 family protein [Actinomycetota bacterium]MDA3012369.1 DUF2017 family protein [Actinomycetota bacterium]MDA3025275.1 DUF2017 family protein [Actinomycetota bacterium]
MIGRRRRAVRRTSDGFVLDLDADEVHLLRRLIGEVRQLVTGASPDDPKLARLFPPAYTDDDGSESEYRRLMHDELVTSRATAIDTVETTLAASETSKNRVVFDAAGLEALATSLNSVRLVLGTLLGITDEDDEPDHDVPEVALYHFLSWMLDGVVEALMTGG